jgi:hypothetical protein
MHFLAGAAGRLTSRPASATRTAGSDVVVKAYAPPMVGGWRGRPVVSRGPTLRTAAFRRLYEAAIHDVLEVLESVGAPYWVTEGTLIELLRYGRNHPPETGRAVDHDVDAMVEVRAPEAWPPLATAIGSELAVRGWIVEPLGSTSSQAGARRDRLRAWRRGDRWTCTRCDLHGYVAEPSRGIAWSHAEAVSYPFQHWGGFVPLEMIHPLGMCRCYERTASVPHRPVELLQGWNDQEYARPCIALPRRRAGPRERALVVDYAERLDAMGFQSFRDELQRCGFVGPRR